MRRAVAMLLVAAAAGCDGPSSYGEFRDQLVARWCDHQVRCGQLGASETARCQLPAALLPGVDGLDVENEVGSHRLHFHPGNARACLDAVKRLPCDDAQAAADLALRCHGILTAGTPTGGACYADGECVGGACVGAHDGCSGTCVAWAPPGSACVPSGGAPATSCDPTVHYCDGVCKPKGGRGATCADDGQCLFHWVCVAGKCADPPRRAAGEACGADQPPCKDGLFCDATGVCAARKAQGEPCSADAGCADGLGCLGGACQPWLDVGQACGAATPSGCPASQTCAAGVCAAQLTKNGPHRPCQSDDDCGDGLYCSGGSCEYRRGALGPCNSDAACASGLSCDLMARACRGPVTCPAAP